jgi:AcrR family transcriptional regulator
VRISKKEQILDAAARHFSRRGFDAASLEEVAAEVGVTKPRYLVHF